MWKSKFTFTVPAALALALALPASAVASDEEIAHLKRENSEMKQMLMQMQEQLREVMMKTNAMEQQVRGATEGAGKKKAGLVKSRKGNQFKIGGRLMYDYDSYDDFWAGDDADDAEIRRSRITFSGEFGQNWSYKFTPDIDHEGEGASVNTGYLKYSSGPMYAMLGKYNRPGMLEERTSSKWISTIERSIITELSAATIGKPDLGGISVGFATQGDMPMSGVVGVYDDQVDELDDGGNIYGVGARFSLMPKFGDHSFLHAGASFYTVDYKGNPHHMRTRMGVHTVGHPFETDRHESDDIDQFGIELAYVNGPFSLQGEFMNVESEGTDNHACGAGIYTPEKIETVEEERRYLAYMTAEAVEDDPSTPDVDETKPAEFEDSRIEVPDKLLADKMDGDIFGNIGPDGAADTDLNLIVKVETVMKETITSQAKTTGFSNTCDIEMDGFYVQAAYTLTGESRGYRSGAGAFAAIRPKGEGGAWEVVARYEDAEVDISGRSLTADLERMVLGVNWYVNKNVKFMLNYVDSEVDGCTAVTRNYTLADATDSGVSSDPLKIKKCNNDDGQAFSLRGQYVF